MAIVAGIDEAGYGPLMGPLVVSAGIFRVPDADLEQCLWKALAGAVTRRAAAKGSALPVADSKLLRVRESLVHLERGVLGMLMQAAPAPKTLTEFLRLLCPRVLTEMDEYPWYAGGDLPLPRQANAIDLALRGNAVTAALQRRGMRLEALRVEPLLEGHYNRMVQATRNKHAALFSITCRLIHYVFHTWSANTPTRIVVDRQGGRSFYQPALQRIFETSRIKILQEDDNCSSYFVQDGPKAATISFQVEGESSSLPTALASMFSKYTRELFMELLNTWWARRVDGLKPTAGYYADGRRFILAVEKAAAELGIDRAMLVRER